LCRDFEVVERKLECNGRADFKAFETVSEKAVGHCEIAANEYA
jgi:hypothetical protein